MCFESETRRHKAGGYEVDYIAARSRGLNARVFRVCKT